MTNRTTSFTTSTPTIEAVADRLERVQTITLHKGAARNPMAALVVIRELRAAGVDETAAIALVKGASELLKAYRAADCEQVEWFGGGVA